LTTNKTNVHEWNDNEKVSHSVINDWLFAIHYSKAADRRRRKNPTTAGRHALRLGVRRVTTGRAALVETANSHGERQNGGLTTNKTNVHEWNGDKAGDGGLTQSHEAAKG
jgi:hypothetical protein